MLRRVLPVVALVAAFVAVPATAEAAPATAAATSPAPTTEYYANATLTLPDGRQATVSLFGQHGPGTPWSGQVDVTLQHPSGCGFPAPPCQSWGSGQTLLGKGQVYFDPKLATAWSSPAVVTVQGWTIDPQTGWMSQTTETVKVRTRFVGTGTETKTRTLSNQCPMNGDPHCRVLEIDGSRDGAATVWFSGTPLSGSAHLNSTYMLVRQLAG